MATLLAIESRIKRGRDMGRSPIIVTAAVFLLLPTPVARADGQDDRFLAKLSAHGISGAPDPLIEAGHETCDALDQGRVGIGMSPYTAAMVHIEGELAGQGVPSAQMSQFVNDSRSIYCPDKA